MNITFLGGGNMAQAIIGGLVRGGFDPGAIRVVEVQPEARERLGHAFPVRCFATPAEAAPFGDLLVMAVKPQHMQQAARAAAPHLHGEPVLSIAAGTRLSDLSRWLGDHALLARCMPNTPALIGAGITALYCVPAVAPLQRELIVRVLESVGEIVWVDQESQLDPVTAVSGSGPAYVFYFIEALEQAARELGLPIEHARKLALSTFIGAARLAVESTDGVAVLRQRVTSRGGTTEAALASMDSDRIREGIVRAIHAAAARARELGVELGRDE